MSDPSTSSPGGGRDRTEHPSGARPKERTNIQQLDPTGTPATAGHVEHQRSEERTINENFDEIDTCLSAGNVDDLHVPISPPPAAQASTSPLVHENDSASSSSSGSEGDRQSAETRPKISDEQHHDSSLDQVTDEKSLSQQAPITDVDSKVAEKRPLGQKVNNKALISAPGSHMQDVSVRDNMIDSGIIYGNVTVHIHNSLSSSLDTGRAHASGARPKKRSVARRLMEVGTKQDIDFVQDMSNNPPPSPPPPPPPPPMDEPSLTVSADAELGKKVKEILNKRTIECAVPRTVGKLKRPKPEKWINPETYEIDFFTSAVPEQEYKPELQFTQQKQKQEGKLILQKDFFQNNEDRSPVRTVAVVGGAGYGKTEILNRFALDVLDKKIPLLGEVEMVHLLRFRDFTEKGKLKAGKLFFGNTDLNDEGIIDPSVDYIRKNPNKFLLVIDGADQYENREDKLGIESPAAQYKEEYFTTDILNSLLSGKLFPDIRVLYSSREHTLRHFQNGVRPHRVIALAGFLEDDVKTLVHELAGGQGEEIWRVLSTKSPGLLSACSIPMYLNFTVSVALAHIDNPPETLTGVMMHVLNNVVLKSYHMRIAEKISKVIHELKEMSFLGTKAGKVTFSSSDLPTGIKESDYKDLIIPLVGEAGPNQRLFEGNFKLIYIHQSLQEAISALYIADMEFGEFQKFVSEQLHTPHWAIVRRILCGILLNDATFQVMRKIDPFSNLLKSGEREKKMNYLKQNLVSLLRKPAWWRPWYRERKGPEFVELLHAIHEGGDDDVISSIWKIDVQDLILTLTPSDWHVITSIIGRAKNLEKVLLPKVHERNIATIAKSLSSSNNKIPRIQEINLEESDLSEHVVSDLATILELSSRIDHLRFASFGENLATILNRSTYIDHLHLATVCREGVASLAAAMENPAFEIQRLSIRELNLESDLKERDVSNLATIMEFCSNIEDLRLAKVGPEVVATLAAALVISTAEIQRLSIGEINYEWQKINEQDLNNLATIFNRSSRVDSLLLPELGLKDVTALAPILRDSNLEILFLSIWKVNVKESDLTNDDISKLATVLSRCSYVVNLSLPALDANHLRTLASALKDTYLKIGYYLIIGVPLQREASLAICDFLLSVEFGVLGCAHLYYTASDEDINLILSKTREHRRQQNYIKMFNEYRREVWL